MQSFALLTLHMIKICRDNKTHITDNIIWAYQIQFNHTYMSEHWGPAAALLTSALSPALLPSETKTPHHLTCHALFLNMSKKADILKIVITLWFSFGFDRWRPLLLNTRKQPLNNGRTLVTDCILFEHIHTQLHLQMSPRAEAFHCESWWESEQWLSEFSPGKHQRGV